MCRGRGRHIWSWVEGGRSIFEAEKIWNSVFYCFSKRGYALYKADTLCMFGFNCSVPKGSADATTDSKIFFISITDFSRCLSFFTKYQKYPSLFHYIKNTFTQIEAVPACGCIHGPKKETHHANCPLTEERIVINDIFNYDQIRFRDVVGDTFTKITIT